LKPQIFRHLQFHDPKLWFTLNDVLVLGEKEKKKKFTRGKR